MKCICRTHSFVQALPERDIVVHKRLLRVFAIRKIALLRVPEMCANKVGKRSGLKVQDLAHVVVDE